VGTAVVDGVRRDDRRTTMTRPPISDRAAGLWVAYRDAVDRGLPRAQMTAALKELIAALDERDRDALTAWFFRRRYDRRGPDLTDRSAIVLLSRDVLVPGLLAGARIGSADHLRWLAFALGDWGLGLPSAAEELYERSRRDGVLAAALARNPAHLGLWRLLFWYELDAAYWVGHHMDEGSLLCTAAEAQAFLDRARAVRAAAPAAALDDGDLAELADLEAAYSAFFAWREAGGSGAYDGPTPRWVPVSPPYRHLR
jgi:hypothetical protein